MQQQNINMVVHNVESTSPIPIESVGNDDDDAKNNQQPSAVIDLEREEGEIIEDEFEDIISSDEEFSMRKRIEELEARNAELEKIANISGIYNYESSSKKDVTVDRNPLATIDLSDLDDYPTTNKNCNQPSSISFANNKQSSSHLQKSTIKSSISYPKRDTHRVHNQYSSRYEISENHNFIPSRRNSSRRQSSSSSEIIFRSVSPIPKTRIRKRNNNRSSGAAGSKSRNRKNKSSIKSQNTKKSITTTVVYEDLSSSDDEEFYALNRNELRLALKRDTNNSEVVNRGNLMNSVNLDKKLFSTIETRIQEEKKENPIKNDDDNIPDVIIEKCDYDNNISSDDSISLEEQELRLIALKSAVVKKHLARKKRKENEEKKPYSPSDFDNIKITPSPNNYDTIETGNSMDISPIASPELILSDNDDDENTKPIDMDLVNSSDSDEPIFVGQENWMPIQEIPLPDELNENNPPQIPIILHSPQPRKLSNNEETIKFINSLIDPQTIEEEEDNKYSEKMDIVNDDENTKIIITSASSPEPTDDEELALRTLLLAKMNNSPKVKNNNLMLQNSIENNNSPIKKSSEIIIQQINNDNNSRHSKHITENVVGRDEFNIVENEVDALRNLILNTMRPNKKTASVLKEAVRRLKNSNNENIQTDDVPSFNEYLNSYQEQSTNQLPINFNLINHNLPHMIDVSSSYLVNNDNSVYDTNTNIQLNQQQQLLPPYFEHNNFHLMPNLIPNIPIQISSPNLIRPGLKLIPIKELTKSREKLINNLKNIQSNDNLIEVNVLPIISQSSNLKEIPLTNNITANEISDNTNEKQPCELISNKEENIVEKPISPKHNDAIENILQSEQSLEISKKIESLMKLSHSIQQTTEISIKSKLPLARKSVPSPLRSGTIVTKKIVNANKVINQSVNTTSTILKRKIPTNQQQQIDDLIKKSRLTLPQSSKSTNNNLNKSRIVTNIEVPTVKKMIINLGNSSATDSEDEFYEMGNMPMENKYNDNASPMSVQMDSPYCSPYPSSYNSPCPSVIPNEKLQPQNQIEEVREEENCENDDNNKEEKLEEENESNEVVVGKSVVNDIFQAKLDQFLKNARTKVESVKKIVDPKPVIEVPVVINQIPVTPLAVRHLPESSQMEYRRLVNRMKILEKQKQAKKTTNLPLTNFQVTITNEKAEPSNQMNMLTNQSLLGIKKTITNDVAVPKLSDDSLIRKILIKNTTNTNTVNKTKEINDTKIDATMNNIKNSVTKSNLNNAVEKPINEIKAKKSDLLQRYETAYFRNGCNILENISKALILIDQGKDSKCKKLLVQDRLEKLNKEIELCKNDLKIHENKMGKIFPAIASLNKVIGNNKIRRIKLHKVSMHLGKCLKGDVYSLKDNNNQEIADKFKQLSVEIKTLKNLQICDIIKNDNNSNLNNLSDDKNINIENIEENMNIIKENNQDNVENINDHKIVDIIRNEIENIDNNDITIENHPASNDITIEYHPPSNDITIENLPASNEITNSNNISIIECAIELTDKIVDNNSKLMSPIVNNIDSTNKSDIPVVEQVIEKKIEYPEIVTEIIEPEILFERNIPTVKTTKFNQKDVTANESLHYSSPLDYKNEERQLTCNPNDVICPYQLMGQCDDKDCKYGHLSNSVEQEKVM